MIAPLWVLGSPSPVEVEITNETSWLDWTTGLFLPIVSLVLAYLAFRVAFRSERRQQEESARRDRLAFADKLIAYAAALRDGKPVPDSDRPVMLGTTPDAYGTVLLEWVYETFGDLEGQYREWSDGSSVRAREIFYDQAVVQIHLWAATGAEPKLPSRADMFLPPPKDHYGS